MSKETKQNIDKIESWLDKKGFALLKSKLPTIEDEVDLDRKVVFLSTRSKLINQLYSLLHECGHIVLRSKKDFKTRFRDTHAIEQGKLTRETNRSLVEKIEEEILAWREGQALAKKLNITLDDNEYYKYGFRWVMSYVVLSSVGKEHYLPVSQSEMEEPIIKIPIQAKDLCAVLDNAHDLCYSNSVSPADEPTTV